MGLFDSLGQEEPLKKEMVTHSIMLAWRIPWTEELGGLQSVAKACSPISCTGLPNSPGLPLSSQPLLTLTGCTCSPKHQGHPMSSPPLLTLITCTCSPTKPHPPDSTQGESSREAQSGRRLLGTNGGSLWLWCCLAQPGALGP